MGMPSVYNQPNWRFRADLDSLNSETSGWLADLNTDVTLDAGTRYRWRVEVEEAGGDSNSTQWKIQYRHQPFGGSFGSWTALPYRSIEDSENGPIVGWESPNFADGDSTTNLLSGSSETFEAGEGIEDRQTNSAQTLSNEHTELELCFMIVGTWGGPNRIGDGDLIELRVVESDDTVFTGTYNIPQITVNVPAGYVGAVYPESPARVGPFADGNGNLYILIEPTPTPGTGNNEPEFLKSTDGGDTWALVDTANSPAENDVEACDVFQDGDTLHVLIQDGSSGANVTYHTFRTSDHSTNADTWGTIDESVTVSTNAVDQACGIVVRSDSSIVAAYRYNDGTNERVGYKIKNGTWGTEQNLDSTASTDFIFCGIVLGASDKTHLFYKDATNGDIYHKSLTSADSLSSRELVEGDAGTAADDWKTTPPVYWDDAGSEVVMIGVMDASDSLLYSVVITDDGTPETRKQISGSAVYEDPGTTGSKQPVADMAVDSATDTVWALFAYSSDKDLYKDSSVNDGGWGTDASEQSGITANFVRGTIFTHSSGNGGAKVYGYWYEDSYLETGSVGENWYAEITLGTPATDSQAIYLAGKATTTDSQAIYLEGASQAVVDIQTNAGRLKFDNVASSYARAIATYATKQSDAEIYCSFQFAETSSGGYLRFWLRGSNNWADFETPTKGYEIEIANTGNWKLYRVETGSRTQIGTTETWTSTTGKWWVRFHADGTNIRARIWADGAGEPGWDQDVNDSASGFTDSGFLQLGYFRIASGPRTVTLDDLSYNAPTSGTTVTDSQTIYLDGQATATDNQPIYTAGQITVTANQAIYLAGVAGATDSQAIYLAGQVVTTDNQAIYLSGADTATDSQAIFLAGQIAVTDSQVIYTAGIDTTTDSQPIYLSGGIVSTDNQAVYLLGQDTATDSQAIYLAGEIVVVDNQAIYLEGVAGANDNQAIYLAGQAVATDNQAIYLAGGLVVTDSQAVYLEGVAGVVDSQAIYLAGQATITDSQVIYLAGQDGAIDSQAVYLVGGLIVTDNQEVYLAGIATATDNQPIYLAGGIVVTDNQAIYLEGSGNTALDNQPIYLAGIATTADSQVVYLVGQDTALDNQAIYLAGGLVVTDSQPIYLAGVAGITDSQAIYLVGQDTTTDSQVIFLAGQAVVTDSQAVYLSGQAVATSSQPIYLEGLTGEVSDSQPIYLVGSITVQDSQVVYLTGYDTVQDNQPIYMVGSATALSSQDIYLFAGTQVLASQAIYLEGVTALQALAGVIYGPSSAGVIRGSDNTGKVYSSDNTGKVYS